jgi:hypothetical protein
MEDRMDCLNTAKKAWMEPKLIVHGNVEHITQQQLKDFGSSDGFTFLGQPILNVS